jgi:nucleotide-binding universal stress UspA family protein
MMTGYRQVLATTDFSDFSRSAVRRAQGIARQHDCELVILHVIEHFPLDGPLTSVFEPRVKPNDMFVVAARQKLQGLLDELKLEGVKAEIILTEQSARKAILEFAREEGFDLIVVAPKGRGLVESLGSTAMGVVNGAHCDVLVVRPSADD